MPELRCLESLRNPGELNKLLIQIRELSKKNKYVSKNRLKSVMEAYTFDAGLVPFEDIIDTARYLQYINIIENSISITRTGYVFLSKNPNNQYHLTKDQENILVQSILFGRTPISEQFELLLEEFFYKKDTNRYECTILTSSGRLRALGIRLFCSAFGLLKYAGEGTHFFDPFYNKDISLLIRAIRQPQWDGDIPSEKILEQSKHAEILIFEYEKHRLVSAGFPELSRNVQLVSDYNSAAGYDIQSFDGEGSRQEIYDRFIEVKSSINDTMHFILSRNERKKAIEYEFKYRIIFVGNHDIGKQLSECRFEEIINPEEHIFNRDRFVLDAPRLFIKERV